MRWGIERIIRRLFMGPVFRDCGDYVEADWERLQLEYPILQKFKCPEDFLNEVIK